MIVKAAQTNAIVYSLFPKKGDGDMEQGEGAATPVAGASIDHIRQPEETDTASTPILDS